MPEPNAGHSALEWDWILLRQFNYFYTLCAELCVVEAKYKQNIKFCPQGGPSIFICTYVPNETYS
jgi:hypothetical protein